MKKPGRTSRSQRVPVIPAKAGIQWLPASCLDSLPGLLSAGVTFFRGNDGERFRFRSAQNVLRSKSRPGSTRFAGSFLQRTTNFVIEVPPRQALAALLIVFALIFNAVAQTLTGTNAQASVPAANELGRFLILEYHLIQEQETRWGRSIPNFKQDLERLYQAGYRPVAMADIIDGKIDLPAGTKPALLSFDDSSPGQFRYLMKNGKKEIDPDCAVGLLLSFHRQHPDWANKAVFFVLPEAKQPHKLFGQPEYEAEKLKELVALGFEIGSHTLWHANLGKYDDTTVQKQLALSVEAIQKRVPGYAVRSLALPFGVYPKDLQLAVKGEFKGTAYRHEAILMVAGGAAQSPFGTGCDLLHLPRIQVPGPDLKYWLSYYEKHPGEVFVSDGKPGIVTFPKALQPRFNSAKFKKLQAVPY